MQAWVLPETGSAYVDLFVMNPSDKVVCQKSFNIHAPSGGESAVRNEAHNR